ncbi:MAG: methyl-accepting chemotaxis protein [Ignavibacteriaceae bacterium]
MHTGYKDRQYIDNSEWISGFEKAIQRLETIFIISDEQFISFSSQLEQFYKRSKEITGTAVNITDLLTSDNYRTGIEKLKSVFDSIFNYLSGSGTNFKESENSLREIILLLKKSAEGVSGFNKVCRHLEMQSISIKIESSRLGNDDKGFRHLADDIHKLSELISKQSNGFKEKAKVLQAVTSEVRNQIIEINSHQEENSKNIFQNTRLSLDSLSGEYELSASKAYSVHSKIEDINRHTGSLVSAVQFHDITHQQMEHVYKIIKEQINNISSNDKINAFKTDEELYVSMHSTSRLQAAQLKNSKDQLINAVSKIISGLEEINENISGVISDIETLLKCGDGGCGSFIHEVKNGLDNIITILGSSENVKNHFSVSVGNVISTIDELSNFINEINDIGSEIELLSLNANIKAAHTGLEGASLSVLAGAIQRLSSDSSTHTNSVIEILLKTKEVSNQLQSTENQDHNSTKLTDFPEEIKNAFNSLNSIAEQAARGLLNITRSAVNLKQDVGASIKSLKSYLKIKDEIDEMINNLNTITAMCEERAGVSCTDEKMMNKIGKDYTMQIQRDIHKEVSSGTKNDGAKAGQSGKENNGEFGDNVELF